MHLCTPIPIKMVLCFSKQPVVVVAIGEGMSEQTTVSLIAHRDELIGVFYLFMIEC